MAARMFSSTILVVGDRPSIHKALAATLRDEGYDLAFVSKSAKALQRAVELVPGLVLLDVVTPSLDGLEL
jgi:CheY-like chemotaxis protein